MVDKIDVLSNFDIENNLSDCSSDENISDLSLSDTSSENSFEECNNGGGKNSDMELGIFKRETIEYKPLSQRKNPSNETALNSFDCKSDNASVASEKTFKLDSPKTVDATPRSEMSQDLDDAVIKDYPELSNKETEDDSNINETLSDRMSTKIGETNLSNDFINDEFSQMEKSLSTDYNQFLDPPKPITDDVNDLEKSNEVLIENKSSFKDTQSISPDDKRFQNLQEEINLLNILMFEAENQTEKCGSLYNSFTNEINNSLAYSKTGVVDDSGGSLASLVDGSKFDALSVKSELLFSDYGKSESNFDVSDAPDQEKVNVKNNFEDVETKSVSSTVHAMSIDSHTSEYKTCKECEAEKTQREKSDEISPMPNEDRILVLWNQIIRLKCTLKNLQLNLKEQQMETLMQINEFLINQSINNSQMLAIKSKSSSSCTLFDRSKDARSPHENLSDTSLIFTENNKIREDIALNNLKIALIECNMLSSTASSLVDSIPKYESSEAELCKSKVCSSISNKSCCCEQIEKRLSCCCPLNVNPFIQARSKSDRLIRSDHHYRIKRQPFAGAFTNVDDKKDRKVKSHEEILNKFPEATKYCLSEVRLDEISPRACV